MVKAKGGTSMKNQNSRDGMIEQLPFSIAMLSDLFHASKSVMPIILLSASAFITRVILALSYGLTFNETGKLTLSLNAYLIVLGVAVAGWFCYTVAWYLYIVKETRAVLVVLVAIVIISTLMAKLTPVTAFEHIWAGLCALVGFLSQEWSVFAEWQTEQVIQDYWNRCAKDNDED